MHGSSVKCGLSGCYREASMRRLTWPSTGCFAIKKDQVSTMTVPVCVTDKVHHGFRNSVFESSIQIVTVVDLYGYSA